MNVTPFYTHLFEAQTGMWTNCKDDAIASVSGASRRGQLPRSGVDLPSRKRGKLALKMHHPTLITACVAGLIALVGLPVVAGALPVDMAACSFAASSVVIDAGWNGWGWDAYPYYGYPAFYDMATIQLGMEPMGIHGHTTSMPGPSVNGMPQPTSAVPGVVVRSALFGCPRKIQFGPLCRTEPMSYERRERGL